VLGFELSHTAHQTGEMAKEITGAAGAEIKLVVLKAPGGHKIELLQYRQLRTNTTTAKAQLMIDVMTSTEAGRVTPV
jgi:hypothetical protein